MKPMRHWIWGTSCLAVICLVGMQSGLLSEDQAKPPSEEAVQQPADTPPATEATPGVALNPVPPRPVPEFLEKSLKWLAAAQHEDGGWGGGSHSQQQILDPAAVPSDPATTSFVSMTFLRVGHTPNEGEYKKVVRKATKYLLKVIEEAPADNPRITQLTGTQPQSKLGPLVDTSMAAQYLARLLPRLKPKSKLYEQVDDALDECLEKLRQGQQEDGSWNYGGGWAPVLQSSLACSSLELAKVVGKDVSGEELRSARNYQKRNFDGVGGAVRTDAAAGVALYAFSGAQRANAAEGKAAMELIDKAKSEGALEADAPVSADNLKKIGVAAPQASRLADANRDIQAAKRQLDDETLLAGFGSNGGEEFLSYVFTSEALVIQGPQEWNSWRDKFAARLQKIQNQDGSWSGHHCITSPVFCTAAVVQCLTTDHEAKLLLQIAANAAEADSAEAAAPKN